MAKNRGRQLELMFGIANERANPELDTTFEDTAGSPVDSIRGAIVGALTLEDKLAAIREKNSDLSQRLEAIKKLAESQKPAKKPCDLFNEEEEEFFMELIDHVRQKDDISMVDRVDLIRAIASKYGKISGPLFEGDEIKFLQAEARDDIPSSWRLKPSELAEERRQLRNRSQGIDLY